MTRNRVGSATALPRTVTPRRRAPVVSPEAPGHPYQAWWDSHPHDLSGSDKQLLTPEDKYYDEKIRYIWYYYGGIDPNDFVETDIFKSGVLLITKEVNELY